MRMPKLLSMSEANEIANAMVDDYGIHDVELRYERESHYDKDLTYKVYKVLTKKHRLFWIRWQTTRKEFWFNCRNPEDCILHLEAILHQEDPRVEKATKIRHNYATLLLNKELERP